MLVIVSQFLAGSIIGLKEMIYNNSCANTLGDYIQNILLASFFTENDIFNDTVL